eukprot:1573496-Pleurochrysis_carterae.AAC.9
MSELKRKFSSATKSSTEETRHLTLTAVYEVNNDPATVGTKPIQPHLRVLNTATEAASVKENHALANALATARAPYRQLNRCLTKRCLSQRRSQ